MTSTWLSNAGRKILQTVQENPKTTKNIIGVTACAIAAPLLTSVAITAVGFGAAGPIAGTLATTWHASIGNVVAGSGFAFLQSAAMGGAAAGTLGWGAAGVGAAAGAAAAAVVNSVGNNEDDVLVDVNNDPGDDNQDEEDENDGNKKIKVEVMEGVLKEDGNEREVKTEVR